LLAHIFRPKVTYVKLNNIHVYTVRGVFDPLPAVSSLLLAELVKEYARGVVVEIGAGTGFLSLLASKLYSVEKVYAVDVSSIAIANCKINIRVNNAYSKVICLSSLESLIRSLKSKADTVILNPPYLPCNPRFKVEVSWCGGSRLEVTKGLISLSCKLLASKGFLLLTLSTLSTPSIDSMVEVIGRSCHPRKVKIVKIRRKLIPWREEIFALAIKVRNR
jgi:methylase of polypeptide subunit release factors